MRRLSCLVVICLALASQGLAQTGAQARLDGLIDDFTADLDGLGPWHVLGSWSLQTKGASGKADFSAALSMVRADNPARQPHTHHVRLTDGEVTPIAGGFRVTGAASMTGNGSVAGFSGSVIVVDVVGGNAIRYSNVRLTFHDGAVGHFGGEPLDGVVSHVR